MPADAKTLHDRAIRRVGVALTGREAQLATAMVARIVEEVPAYRSAPEDVLGDVRVLSTATAEALNRSLATLTPVRRGDVAIVGEHAARRLRQGIELDAFLHAHRAALFHYWDACAAQAGRLRISAAASLALAGYALDNIDTITTHAAESYLREDARLRSETGRTERDLVDRLIAGQPVDTERRHRAAPGLDPSGTLVVAVGRVASDGPPRPDALELACGLFRDALAFGKTRPLVVLRQGEIVVLAGGATPRSRLHTTARRAREEHGIDLRQGVSPCPHGFGGVARAYNEAIATLSHSSPARPVVALDELSPMQLALLGTDAQTRALIATHSEHLRALTDQDRDTIVAYGRADMNIAGTANELFVHPNTVRYRLARIARLTGYDPRTFTGLTDLHCLLELTPEQSST